jgi:hypothetical protein
MDSLRQAIEKPFYHGKIAVFFFCVFRVFSGLHHLRAYNFSADILGGCPRIESLLRKKLDLTWFFHYFR